MAVVVIVEDVKLPCRFSPSVAITAGKQSIAVIETAKSDTNCREKSMTDREESEKENQGIVSKFQRECECECE